MAFDKNEVDSTSLFLRVKFGINFVGGMGGGCKECAGRGIIKNYIF